MLVMSQFRRPSQLKHPEPSQARLFNTSGVHDSQPQMLDEVVGRGVGKGVGVAVGTAVA